MDESSLCIRRVKFEIEADDTLLVLKCDYKWFESSNVNPLSIISRSDR